jgi:hypothetical protein
MIEPAFFRALVYGALPFMILSLFLAFDAYETRKGLRALREALMEAEEDAAFYRAQRDDLMDSLHRLTHSTDALLSALERPIIVPPAGGMVA